MASKKLFAATVSIGVNIFLIILKIIVAVLTGSLVILAALVDSLFDLIASFLAYFGIKYAEKPADKKYPYGYGKVESLSSLIQIILIIITSIIIIYEAITRIISPQKVAFSDIGIAFVVFNIIVAFLLSRYLHKVSVKESSIALEADAYHFKTDTFSYLSALVGLIFVNMGFDIADPIAAISIAIFMMVSASSIGKKSIDVLIDRSPSNEIIDKIGRSVSKTKGIVDYHHLRARYVGNKISVDITVRVSREHSIRKAHHLVEGMKKRIKKAVPQIHEIIIHIEPYSVRRPTPH